MEAATYNRGGQSLDTKREKELIRQRTWRTLESTDIANFPRPCFGRIPNFKGSREASEKIRTLEEFRKAKCIFTAPDFVLKRVREIVLEEGKTLAIALPNMEEFLEIDEREKIDLATNIKGFKRFGKPLKKKIDLFVQGSVAVDMYGNRLGKGKGYGDKEWSFLLSKKLISSTTKVVTIVHELQILDDFSELCDEHDKKVDYILTPKRIIKIPH